MSPAQYRALEALADADWIGTRLGDENDPPATIHRDTAFALERRGLAVVIVDERDTDGAPRPPYAKITTAGLDLLRTNPKTREEATR